MTKLDKFVAFARDLPREQLDAIEAALDEIMETFFSEHDLTAEEIAELRRRIASPNRKRADSKAVERILGQKLPRMTRVVFDDAALVDLQGIVDWYAEVAPDSLPRIMVDINRSLRQISDYPLSAPAVSGEIFRRIVTVKYGFKIAYEVEPDEVVIVGIFRFQDRIR